MADDPANRVKKVDRGKRLRAMDQDKYRAKLRALLLRHIVEESNGCWRWTAKKQRNGYASCRMMGKTTPAHRASFYAFKGEIPEGMEVCHTCDVRDCINPEHLFLGTHLDNMQDANRKGRIRKGADNNRSLAVSVSGVVYGSIREAARCLGVGHGSILHMVRKNRATLLTEA